MARTRALRPVVAQTAVPPSEKTTRLWTIRETADYLAVPVATLYQWRHRGEGPRSFRVGGLVRYDPEDVRQWVGECA